MTQAASMGPPLSPRETRRSGRRSAPSVSASASKSPDSDQPPREKATVSRVASSSSNSRSKKLKQEDYEEVIDDRKSNTNGSSAASSSSNGANSNKAKRKAKDEKKDRTSSNGGVPDVDATPTADVQPQEQAEEEEEQGITRCVCGSSEDDPDAGEFMVQCETCKVWQHGLCMGYQSEDQVHDDDYYCEQCRPELHVELIKKLAKKARQSSATTRPDPVSHARVSRSHSPSHLLKQPSKRRNTMNSRDAAFDESLKEIIEATAAEAAAVQDGPSDSSLIRTDSNDATKKKRKRTDDDSNPKKRTRSASMGSEGRNQVDPVVESPEVDKAPAPISKPNATKNKRGGRKTATIEITMTETDEVTSTTTAVTHKRTGNSSRSKSLAGSKRPPISQSVSHGSGAASHEHGTRRNQSGTGQQGGISAADARAYRNSHAYVVSQQSLFTSWNLPDYLSHLEQMLPSHTPQPLEVRSGATNPASNSRSGSVELTMERGVKVKWPAKRMSVGDMNKRVRALVEWVGREQASALDRGRRREALESALREQAKNARESGSDPDIAMVVDETAPTTKTSLESQLMPESALETSAQTMKMMEELMEELIGFQERFGPGAKTRDRDRRQGMTTGT
ncbi:hypothetical protein CPC08DRAFT_814611 [Agrocybe pediades]|nr:hypothetical protein CPC08DRAFT_814611 [Agrocybe pediades]